MSSNKSQKIEDLYPNTTKHAQHQYDGYLESNRVKRKLTHAMSVVAPSEASFRFAAMKKDPSKARLSKMMTIADEELNLEPSMQFKHKALVEHSTAKV